MSPWLAAALLTLSLAPPAQPASTGVDLGGELTLLIDGLPRQDALEMRPELVLEASIDLGRGVRARGDVAVSALASRRYGSSRTDLVVRPRDTWIEVAGSRAELRAGYGQLTWGRLDEIQPIDVINPLDASRFLLEGRSVARLPVAFARGRVFLSDDVVLEGVLVPWFRRGRFDELDENESPFNLTRVVGTPAGTEAIGATTGRGLTHAEPGRRWANVSGGGRVSATVGRVDVSVVAYRGFDAFGPIVFEPALPLAGPLAIPGRLVERHERFTMIGGDFETVRGAWGWRGELAAFVRKRLAAASRPGLVDGHVVEAGIGVDRRASGFRLYGAVFGRREWSAEDPAVNRADTSLMGSVERTLARDRYTVRVFGLVNPADGSGFLRGLVSWRIEDNVVLDASAGTFLGTGDDTISRFDDRDFVFARLRYYF